MVSGCALDGGRVHGNQQHAGVRCFRTASGPLTAVSAQKRTVSIFRCRFFEKESDCRTALEMLIARRRANPPPLEKSMCAQEITE